MRTRDSKLFKFILEFSQILLVFFGVYSAIMCTATSLEMTFDDWLITILFFVASILFYFLFSVLETFRKGKLYGILGITAFFAIIALRFAGAMKKGVIAAVNSFLKEFMNYTGTNLSLVSYTETDGSSIRFCTNLFLILVGLYLIAIISAFFYRRRRSKVFVCATVPFVLLPLVVGKLGEFFNFFTYLIVAMTIIGTRHLRTDATDRRMRQKLAIILMMVGLLCGGICYLVISPKRYYNNVDRLTQAKNTIFALTSWSGEDVLTWLKAYWNDDAITYGHIGDKDKISFKGETMFKVSGTVNNQYGMYLKGYVGEQYKNNKWSSLHSNEEYEKDLKELDSTGVTLENWHAQLRNELGDNSRKGAGLDNIWETQTLHVRNLAFGYGNYIVPYLPTDSFKKKNNGRYTVENPGIEYEVEYYPNYSQILRIDVLHPRYNDGNRLASQRFWEGNKAERQKLKAFADKYYCDVPDDLSGVVKDFNSYKKRYEFTLRVDQMTSTSQRSSLSDMIKTVKEYLAENTTYSLSPGKTPSDQDAVEFFLKENKKGYCTHYATAAAVLLRSQGIPTRYVEGVYIPRERLKEAIERKDEIPVLDEDVHAWIEVYDEDYGFVPVEVTPGRGEEDVVQSEKPSSENGQNNNDSGDSQEEEPEEKPDTVTPTPEVTQKPEESMIFDDIEGNEDQPEEQNSNQRNSSDTQAIRILLGVLIVLAAFVLVMEGQRRIRKKIFLRNMRSYKAKRRIRMAYHHLVPILKKRGVVYRGQSMAELTSEISAAMGLREEVIEVFVELLYHARFGPDTIDQEKLRLFGEVYNLIRDKAYEDVRLIKKLYYMYIMVL